MKSHAQVVVIGGGVVGASVLYHLTKAGWANVVLVERSELTSGSTWHAAGGMHTVNGDPNVAKLQAYTINLYKEIEAISGQSCGIHITAGLMLAGTPARLDFLKMMASRAKYLGLDMEMLSIDRAAEMFPMMDKKHFIGALYNTLEGHVDPSGVTHAYAKAARIGGAEVYRHTRVVETKPRTDGSWDVITEKGTIVAEHVVNAGGLWAREVGRMAGLELPILAMEHQYIITEDIPEVVASEKEVLHIIDFEGEIYMRQEGRGMLIGTYERAGVPWSPKNTPWSFGHELLENDLERIAPSLEVGFSHFPALGRAGIKKVINGPFTFAPDGNPLVGPVRGLRNYWVACGVMAGLSQGGGVGLALSNWMVHGDPGYDIWGMDVARYGEWTTPAYTNAKVRENYSRRFRVRFPGEELPAARRLRTTPLYDTHDKAGAIFGTAYGLEFPLWYAKDGESREENWSFRRNNSFPAIARECAQVRNGVGLMEISTYAKYDVSGPRAEQFLDSILANRLPRQGRIALSPMLADNGKLLGDFTLARLSDEKFLVVGSGVAEAHHMRWFSGHLPENGVTIRPFGLDLVGLSIAGPRSRDLLAVASGEDVSNGAFPLFAINRMEIGLVPALVGRISFTGDLGYEIWVKPEHQRALYDALIAAGEGFGIGLFGSRALHSMRLAKGYGTWAREYRPIYGPYEAGLDRFVALNKGTFIGSDAALREREQGGTYRLILMAVDAAEADAGGDEPILHNGKTVGWVTSGGYAHTHDVSLAMGYVKKEVAADTDGFDIEIIGERRKAKRLPKAPFDPEGTRMRG